MTNPTGRARRDLQDALALRREFAAALATGNAALGGYVRAVVEADIAALQAAAALGDPAGAAALEPAHAALRLWLGRIRESSPGPGRALERAGQLAAGERLEPLLERAATGRGAGPELGAALADRERAVG